MHPIIRQEEAKQYFVLTLKNKEYENNTNKANK